MKKLLSLFLAVAVMAASSTAFAAVSITNDGSGNMLADSTTIPAKAYYQAAVPATAIAVTQLTAKADVQAASTAKFANQTSLDTYDIYKLDITVSSMGELVNGCDENWDSAYAGAYAVKVTFPTTAFAKNYINPNQIAGGNSQAGQDGSNFNVMWSASAVTNPYPIFDDTADPTVTQYQADGEMTISLLVAIAKNSSLSLSTVATKVTYVGGNFTGGSAENSNAANVTLTLPAGPTTVPVTSVTISGATAATVGDSVALSATVAPNEATDKEVTWTLVSGDGSVSSAGVVTANSAGDVVVKATAGGVDSADYTVSFAAAEVPATGVAISGGATKAVVGDAITFSATVDPSSTTDALVWSGTGVVDNGDGTATITASSAGKYTITATAGSVSDSKDITFVAAPVAPVVDNAKAVNTNVTTSGGDYNYLIQHAQIVSPDVLNFRYEVWATAVGEIGEKTWEIDSAKFGEIAGKTNFILMIKSKTHTIEAAGIRTVLK